MVKAFFQQLSNDNQFPVSLDEQISPNPVLPILGVYDSGSENANFWAVGLGSEDNEYLTSGNDSAMWVGAVQSGKFRLLFSLPSHAKIWQLFSKGVVYSSGTSLYSSVGEVTYLLDKLSAEQVYTSVLFDKVSNLLFVVYQDQPDSWRLKYIRPQGNQIDLYKFTSNAPQIISYDNNAQQLLLSSGQPEKQQLLDLVTKEVTTITTINAGSYKVLPPAQQAYNTSDIVNSLVASDNSVLLKSAIGHPIRLAAVRGELVSYLQEQLTGPLADAYAAQDLSVVMYDLNKGTELWESVELPADHIRQLFIDADGLVYAVTESLGGVETVVVYNVSEQVWDRVQVPTCSANCIYQFILN